MVDSFGACVERVSGNVSEGAIGGAELAGVEWTAGSAEVQREDAMWLLFIIILFQLLPLFRVVTVEAGGAVEAVQGFSVTKNKSYYGGCGGHLSYFIVCWPQWQKHRNVAHDHFGNPIKT
jgi:hypothetical protein